MKRPYQVFGVVLILFAIYMIRESLLLRFYTPLGPGPGFFPLLVSIIICLLGGSILYSATFRQSDPMPEDFFPDRAGLLRILAIVGSMIVVVVAMNPLGFRITMVVFLGFLLSTLGGRKPVTTILVSVLAPLITFHVFNELLLIPLPVGMFDF